MPGSLWINEHPLWATGWAITLVIVLLLILQRTAYVRRWLVRHKWCSDKKDRVHTNVNRLREEAQDAAVKAAEDSNVNREERKGPSDPLHGSDTSALGQGSDISDPLHESDSSILSPKAPRRPPSDDQHQGPGD